MVIRKTKDSDLQALDAIFEQARRYMCESGNPTQWKDNRPSMDVVRQDIANGNSYVCVENDKVVATFAFIVGVDSTYLDIDGAWLNDKPYGTIHRLASSGEVKGLGNYVFEWCKKQGVDLRIDTHKDNATMLHIIEKFGFIRCGVIFVDDGTPREAFQYTNKRR